MKNQLQYPDFLEVQLKSFQGLFSIGYDRLKNRKNEGLYTVFARRTFLLPIPGTILFWNFWTIIIDPPRYTIDECLEQRIDLRCCL